MTGFNKVCSSQRHPISNHDRYTVWFDFLTGTSRLSLIPASLTYQYSDNHNKQGYKLNHVIFIMMYNTYK